MQEGDPASYVIVILSGWTKICVREHGRERIIATRGPGQLVGERGALQVSIRSASVVARMTVRALEVRTEDFAAFISEHPGVLAIVEGQVYNRLTEEPAGCDCEDCPRGARPVSPPPGAVVERLGDWQPAGSSGLLPQALTGENCTVLLTDVAEFGSRIRKDGDRLIIRKAILKMTRATLANLGTGWRIEDRGDGILTILPPSIPTMTVIEHLLTEIPGALKKHNMANPGAARIQLRVAVDVGPISTDDLGSSGEAIIQAARLVDAPKFKRAMIKSGASLGVIASPFVYETAIRHGQAPIEAADYCSVDVKVKEYRGSAWMALIDKAAPAPRSLWSRFTGRYRRLLKQWSQPGQGVPEVGLGGGLGGLGQGQPAQRGVRGFRTDHVGGGRGHEEADVGVLVGGLTFAGGDADDDYLPDRCVGPGDQVGEAGFFLGFPGDDGEGVGLAGVAVAADLQPGLLTLVPAEEHACRRRVGDQGGRGDVEREIAPVGITGGLEQRAEPLHVGRLGVVRGVVLVQEGGQVRHRTSMAGGR
jgi:hypothetical protein